MSSKWGIHILTLGLAFVFVWFGIDKFVHPLLWIDFLPEWMTGFLGITRETWLSVLGVLEIIMGVMIVIPVRVIRQAGASIISLHLLVIVWEIGLTDIGVRDVGLLTSAVALLLLL